MSGFAYRTGRVSTWELEDLHCIRYERKDSPILAGYQIYHNYIKPHKALENRTPAETAGIEIKGKDKWLSVIQNAALDGAVTKRPR